MEERVSKGCTVASNYRWDYCCYVRARDGFGALMDVLKIGAGDKILVPGYIGWSPREGSGVFDPIEERALNPVFYHLNDKLAICEGDIEQKINTSGARALLLIHYFGFPDANAWKYAELAKEKGIIVIEDCAHAMYTNMTHGGCGCFGDYSIYSLHKMLPVASGGMLRARRGATMPVSEYQPVCKPFDYDFYTIAKTRRMNYMTLNQIVQGVSNLIVPLYEALPDDVVPQTYPIVMPHSDRDRIYEYMNAKGWGVVSLYHTMIKSIQDDDFLQEKKLSRMIMNLPVHQDVDHTLYLEMVKDLVEAAGNFRLEREL